MYVPYGLTVSTPLVSGGCIVLVKGVGMTTNWLLIGILAAGSTGAAAVSDTASGVRAYKNGDYSAAMTEWKAAAERGDSQAQYYIGVLYAHGQGVAKDFGEALRWYRTAADRGNAHAEFAMGQIYSQGWGLPQDAAATLRWIQSGENDEPNWLYTEGYGIAPDFAIAAEWYRKAANQGDAGAQYSLARLYARGRGVPKDNAEAAKWLRLAARQGYGPAQERLGRRYAEGVGVPKVDRQAYFWLTLASKSGEKSGEKLRTTLAAKLTPEDKAGAEEAALRWRPVRAKAVNELAEKK